LFGYFNGRKLKFNLENSEYHPFVSIIVPARNEKNNIENCVISLFESTYPRDRYEVIVVNDRSTDETGEILSKLACQFTGLRIIEVTEDSADRNLQGKPGALQFGIEHAKGEILLFTDADCQVGRKWIEVMSGYFADPEVGMIASFTNVINKNLFERMQAIEWIYLQAMATAGLGLGHPLGCYGNNLSIRLKDFKDVGGYRKIKFSLTEDLALLTAVSKRGRKAGYICQNDTMVFTKPCRTFGEYLSQHHRWALGGMELGWKAVVFVITSLALWGGLIISVVTGDPLWLILPAIRISGEYLMIYSSLNKLRVPELKKWTFFAIIFFLLMEPVIPILLLSKTVSWKGQVFNK
jgi:cellulose synthase/poly-beta-1,6-N-acetylglucosamine synthase-like glycosyltransferase